MLKEISDRIFYKFLIAFTVISFGIAVAWNGVISEHLEEEMQRTKELEETNNRLWRIVEYQIEEC